MENKLIWKTDFGWSRLYDVIINNSILWIDNY